MNAYREIQSPMKWFVETVYMCIIAHASTKVVGLYIFVFKFDCSRRLRYVIIAVRVRGERGSLMERIMVFNHDKPEIGLYTRTTTEGEELELVKKFIDFYCNKFIHDNKVNNLAVFVEPRVASGFPDIVFASYTPSILDNWSETREHLDTFDLKILSHLIMTKGCEGLHLMAALKMPEKQILISLEKLLDAKLIYRSVGTWKPRELKNIYNIKKLVSVEAKVSDMKKVVEQSLINTWFASQSYALSKSSTPQNNTIQYFENRGIGLYCKTKSFKKVVEAKRLTLPSSYLSLQFNEWIGKANTH